MKENETSEGIIEMEEVIAVVHRDKSITLEPVQKS